MSLVNVLPSPAVAPEGEAPDLRTPPAGQPGPQPGAPPELGLSPREAQVLELLSLGRSNREIADELYLSAETIKGYVSDVFGKLGCRNRVEATRLWLGFALDRPAEPTVVPATSTPAATDVSTR